MVGGRDFQQSQFNRAVQAHRQPGSAFKPIVALAALQHNDDDEAIPFTLVTGLEDEPLTVPVPDGEWVPENYAGKFEGRVTLREAIERSLNVPIARLGLELGFERIIETAHRLARRFARSERSSTARGPFSKSGSRPRSSNSSRRRSTS